MQRTANYNLNKPEAGDPLRLADFNANADIIDGALKNQANDLAVLSTTVAGMGNCKIATGSYDGNDAYGADNPTRLDVGFAPKMVIIGFDGKYCRMFLPIWSKHFDFGSAFSSETYTTTWGDTYFSIYSGSSYGQMNSSGRTYNYIAIG